MGEGGALMLSIMERPKFGTPHDARHQPCRPVPVYSLRETVSS